MLVYICTTRQKDRSQFQHVRWYGFSFLLENDRCITRLSGLLASNSAVFLYRYASICVGAAQHVHPPAVAMVLTKVKPVLLSGECYMGSCDMKAGAINPHHRELQANMS